MLTSTIFTTLLLALPALGFSDRAVHEQSRSRARAHYKRIPAPVPEPEVGLSVDVQKRASYSGRATFYDVGLGACGGYNVASDYIVAQNSDQYGGGYPGPNCGRSISISYGGKTLTATIQDECPTCPYGGLDMSRGLFDAFADESVGVFYMTWWYNDESQATTTSTSTTPTSTWVAPSTSTTPTSTWVAPTTTSTTPTSTWVEPSTTSTTASSTYSSSSSSSSSASSYASSSAVSSASSSSTNSSSSALPTTSAFGDVVTTNTTDTSSSGVSGSGRASATASAQNAESTSVDVSLGNLVLFNQAVAYLGHIVVVGAEK